MSDPNDQKNESVFINSRVNFPMTNFRPTSNHDADGQNIIYNLFATINHHPTKEGRNKHFGHFTAQCKYPNTIYWIEYNDQVWGLNNFINRQNLNKMKVHYQHFACILFYIKRENPALTQIETIVQENIQHQDESIMTDRHHNEGTNVTAIPTLSPARQHRLCLMTGAECMLPRGAYDALERKRTVRFNQGQPEDKGTNDKGVDIRVWVTKTGTQDTTVHQESTQLDQTNGNSSETLAIPNATATLTQSPARQCPLCLMTGVEHMLPRGAYDALERKCTVHFN
jgi:hypothetical protein